jgi:hypothetical protein
MVKFFHQITKIFSSNLFKNYLFCLPKFRCGYALDVLIRKNQYLSLFVEFEAKNTFKIRNHKY